MRERVRDPPLSGAASRILAGARAAGRRFLLETEGLALLQAELGLDVPLHLSVRDAREAAEANLEALPSDRVVVKVASSALRHKSDVGGVVVVPKKRSAVVAAVAAMQQRVAGHDVAGFSLNEHVGHDVALGGELLIGMRWSAEFGPIVTLAPGGIFAEHLAGHLRARSGAAILSPALGAPTAEILAAKAITPAVTGALRGHGGRLAMPRLVQLVERFLDLAARSVPHPIAALEINPLALTDSGPVALDAVVELGGLDVSEARVRRPIEKIDRLLHPRTLAVIGVSRQLNPGRVILRNVLRMGFAREHVFVIKPGLATIDGCRCYDDVSSLPRRVDLLVVAIDAAGVPALLDEVLEQRKAESLILIPGGLGERRGSEAHAERLAAALEKARRSAWQGPVINGGNCLGIRSRPGRYDTLFIPRRKLRFREAGTAPPTPLALVSQSGAFAIARTSRLAALDPRYLVTVGNQVDLTVGDYLTHLKDDPEIEIFAFYVEGFRPLDGRSFMAAAAEITASGRAVILYRAGRTPEGSDAAASHTASLAGDYAATRELAAAAGVVLAETAADFDDLVRTFCQLRGRRAGFRLGALSNAGFECVAIADHLGRLRLASFSEATRRGLAEILESDGLASIVDVRNPFDTTPILGDEAFARAAELVLGDDGVDVAVVGCVPLTGALETLGAAPEHREDVRHEGSVVRRLAELAAASAKAWVAVVDSGELYDPMANLLEEHGIPVFRTAERALKALESFCRWRCPAAVAEKRTRDRRSPSK